MTLAQVCAMLERTGLPVTYQAWPQDPENNLPPPLPWICYVEGPSANESADGVVYYRARQIRIELYSRDKDPINESAVESVLDAAEIFWQKTDESYIESENAIEVIYEIEV